jgi:hypothetical protein
MISATVNGPISGAVPEMWMSPSLGGLLADGVFADLCANFGVNITSMVARFFRSSMNLLELQRGAGAGRLLVSGLTAVTGALKHASGQESDRRLSHGS